MIRHIGLHGSNHGDIIDASSHMRKEVTDLDPTLPMMLEFKRRCKSSARLTFGAQILRRQHLPGIAVKLWLGIKAVHVRRPTIHEEMDHSLCLAGKQGLTRCKRNSGFSRGMRGGGEKPRSAQQTLQAKRTEAHTQSGKESSPGGLAYPVRVD